ncbi:hypothetical protein [Vibrio sonorensis]|uniref:hypothetical protein n=1 Tax=Vibrio sonorensis TaxID=1004316 RepID=UPI0008DABA07|nr:hypothetical protein [Vibrio sonorensis]
MKEKFENWRPSKESQHLVEIIESVLDQYAREGYVLSLRQLYYQFVARDLIPNTERSYANLGNIVGRARASGEVDWGLIEDRGRQRKANVHWTSPLNGIESLISSYQIDKWEHQDYYLEVWVEKEALSDVVGQVCRPLDVAFFACRGYNSQSEMYQAGKRLQYQSSLGKKPIVLHLGDHDPSGIDMTADNENRLSMFAREPIEVKRLALNMDQIERYNPPPNPTKLTDSRSKRYVEQFGAYSWELDALEPAVLSELIEDNVKRYRDDHVWQKALEREIEHKEKLKRLVGFL